MLSLSSNAKDTGYTDPEIEARILVAIPKLVRGAARCGRLPVTQEIQMGSNPIRTAELCMVGGYQSQRMSA